jgi:AraC-like DNA-binding protein
MRAGFGTIDPFFAEALFDCTPDVVFFVKDTEGRYRVVNDTLVRRCGRRAKGDVLGRTAEDLFPPPLGALYAAQDRLVLSGRAEIRDRLELHLYDDGTRGFCLTYKLPLRGRDGRIVGMAGLSRDLHRPDEGRRSYRALGRAVDRLQAGFAEPVRLAELARGAGMSESRFQRLTKRVFHLTPRQLLIKTRVEAASRLLLETEARVAEIAMRCGYADHSAFTRQFKATTGLTPMQFRKSQRG